LADQYVAELKKREEANKHEALKNATLPSGASMSFTIPVNTSLPDSNVLSYKSFVPIIPLSTTQHHEEPTITGLIKKEIEIEELVKEKTIKKEPTSNESIKKGIIKEQAGKDDLVKKEVAKKETVTKDTVKKESVKIKKGIKEEEKKKPQIHISTIPKASTYYQKISSVFAPPLSLESTTTQPVVSTTNKVPLSLKDKFALSGIIKPEQSNTLQ